MCLGGFRRPLFVAGPSYIEGVYESFKEDIVGRKSHVSNLFPDDVFISRDKSKIPKEEARKFLDKAFMWMSTLGS